MSALATIDTAMRPATIVLALATYACSGPGPSEPEEPAGPPVGLTVADITPISDATYPVEDGPTITVVFTNFCEQPTQFGFSPDEGGPPIVWTIQPRQRQSITIPRGYSLRGRLETTKTWTPANCLANKNGHHLTFNKDCESCTSGKTDPLERETCIAAGTCTEQEAAAWTEPGSS